MEENDATTTTGTKSNFSVRMVIQRYRSAKLLINENEIVTVGEPSDLVFSEDQSPSSTAGILVYISFAQMATKIKAEQAAKTLLNLPVLTTGAWGDGSGTKSILQLSAENENDKCTTPKDHHSALSILLVPQANVIAKVKKIGKSIQYRDQISKAEGEELFQYFVETVERLLVEHQDGIREGGGGRPTDSGISGSVKKHTTGTATPDPSILPSRLFHQDGTYGSFEVENDQTFPLTYANGEPLTKSARKKLQKIYNAHVIRHTRYMETAGTTSLCKKSNGSSPTSKPDVIVETTEPDVRTKLDPSFVQLIAGSFGKRQGLEIQSDMGPFCHVVDIE